MGFATIMVLFYHFGFVGRNPLILPFNALSQIGFGGVDVFMMLSGFGLTFSMFKNPDTISFYKKRVTRLLPSFLVLTIVGCMLNTSDPWQIILWKCTTLGYWTNLIIHEWYTPAIISLYALFPLVFKYIIKDKKDVRLFIVIGLSLVLMVEELFYTHAHWYHIVLINRLPIFFFGCFIAKRIKENRPWTAYCKVAISLIPVAAFIFLLPHQKYSFWCVVAFIMPFFLILMCKMLDIKYINQIMGGG